MRTITSEKICRLRQILEDARRITVTSHTRPDGDALGSTTGMLSFIRSFYDAEVKVVLPDSITGNIAFIRPVGSEGMYLDHSVQPAESSEWIESSDLLICLDFCSFSRTAALEQALSASSAVKILVDHHLNPDEPAFDLVFSTPDVSSASELLYHILLAMPQTGGDASGLPSDGAYALMSGMTTDTNNFANSVYPSTFRMASELISAGVDRDDIISHVYNSYRENRLRITGFLLDSRMTVTSCGVAYTILRADEQRRFDLQEGELEGYVNMPLQIDAVKISIFLREDEGYFRVSIRSKRGWSANSMASGFFHGGGHEQAAGGRLYFPQDIAGPADAESYIMDILEKGI